MSDFTERQLKILVAAMETTKEKFQFPKNYRWWEIDSLIGYLNDLLQDERNYKRNRKSQLATERRCSTRT